MCNWGVRWVAALLLVGAVHGLTALEFYSGIGGFRAALAQACGDSQRMQVTAYDVNEAANAAYQHVWNERVVCKSIEHLTQTSLPPSDLWLLSPPCQPYTRIGLQRDTADPRSKSFLHLMELLQGMEACPQRLMLENVQGFEGSDTCARLMEVLALRGYQVHQFLLSPTQLGIPNTRTRYYCLAFQRSSGQSCVHAPSLEFPAQAAPQDLSAAAQPSSIAQYLEQLSAREVADFAVEDRVAAAAARQPLDVATAASTATITFTKGYGRQIGKAGPYLLLSEDGVTVEWGGRARFSFVEGGQKLRYFTPREMLRVAGFPESFVFSPGTSNRAAYKLIGNSINVTVVSRLLSWLLAQG